LRTRLKRAKLSLHTTLRARGGVDAQFHSFLILSLDRGEWLTSRCGRFTPGKQLRYSMNLKKESNTTTTTTTITTTTTTTTITTTTTTNNNNNNNNNKLKIR